MSGERIFAVSAMKRTPQKAITSASVACGLAGEIEAVADEVGNVLDFRRLVIMGEDDGVALLAQPVDLGAEVETLEARTGCVHGVPRPDPRHRSAGADRGQLAVSRPSGPTNRTATLASMPAARSGKAKAPRDVPQRGVAGPGHRQRRRAPDGSVPPAPRGGWPRRSSAPRRSGPSRSPPSEYSCARAKSICGPATSSGGSVTVSVVVAASQARSRAAQPARSTS